MSTVDLFRYGRHWLGAKGRHGTHSPFVYAFVEQVLRSRRKFAGTTAAAAGQAGGYSRRTRVLLYRALSFLKPETILLPQELFSEISEPAGALLPGCKIVDIGCLPSGETRNAVIIIDGLNRDKRVTDAIITQLKTAVARIIVLRPHVVANKGPELWSYLVSEASVKMSLDCWHIGLLLNDPAFKAKQYFRLR